MQPLPSTANSYPDCYLQVRRGKQTIFTDVAESTTLTELKQILANILKINSETIRLTAKGQVLDIDGKHLLEYGITTKESRPQAPYQLEMTLQLDDGSYETEEVVPYTAESNASSDDPQQIGIPVDSK